jgi:hypothetical protein
MCTKSFYEKLIACHVVCVKGTKLGVKIRFFYERFLFDIIFDVDSSKF